MGFAAVLLLAVQGAPALAEATVRDIRIAALDDGTRVVLDLSRRVSFSHITLSNPPRLAIDLPEVAWLVPDSFGEQPAGLVKGFRFGRFRPGISRLVLDVAGPFAIRDVFELPPTDGRGYRIVTDLALARPEPSGGRVEPASLSGPAQRPVNGAVDRQTTGTGTAALPVPVRRPPAPDAAARERVVVVDPGHGGIDPGAIGSDGVYEKDIVLDVGRALRRALEGLGRYRVVMTRDGDETVRLRERLDVARSARGDLFVSLHADSLVKAPEVRGASVYTLSEDASNQEAAALARKENRADILAGVDLSEQEDIVTRILIDLAQRDAKNRSIRFAGLLVDELDEVSAMSRRRWLQAGFVVLKSPDVPSVLVELGFLSNPEDERLLQDPEHQAALAQAIADAINRYFTAEAS